MKLSIKQIYIFIIAFIMLAYTCYSQDSTSGIFHTVWNDIKCSGNTANYIGNEFVHMSAPSYYTIGGVAGITALSVFLDHEARSIALKYYIKDSQFLKITNEFGNGLYSLGFSGATYLGGLFIDNEPIRTTGRMMFEVLVVAGITNYTLKVAFGRARPFTNNGNGDFRFFQFDDKYQSFPSGHTTGAFSIASVIAGRIDKWWAYAGCYSLASMTGVSRMYYDKHWFSDALLGAAIGIISGNVIVSAENNRNKNKSAQSGLIITPNLNGISCVYIF